MRFGLLVVLVLGACYDPPRSDGNCSISCTEGVANNCPGDLACEGGYCVAPGQVCRPTFVQTTAGTGFACAIDDQAALWCWGELTGTAVATRVDTTRHWEALDGGGGQVCGIADGQLYCWGENDDREVSGTVVGDVAAPLRIEANGIATWTHVSAGVDYSCATGDGQLVCWGKNDKGQLGDGTTMDRGVPTPVAANITDWTDVSAGDTHTCAISTLFGVHCWGRDDYGDLGVNGAGGSAMPVAVTMQSNPLLAADIAVAVQTSCAIGLDQQLYCWGLSSNGQFGDKRLVDPTMIAMSDEPLRGSDVPFTKIEGAQAHFCALAGDAVYCWGEASAGGLGNGIWTDARVFTKVISAGAHDVSVGNARNATTNARDLDLGCAIVGGDAQCWGDNRYGQLGQGTRTQSITPTEVAGRHAFTHVAAGAQHMCGIGDDKTLYCWGSTERGQTTGFIYGGGAPRTPCATNPTDPSQPLCDVGAPRSISYAPDPKAVETGTAHTCALANGVVSCWGNGLTNGGAALKRELLQPAGSMWKTLLPTGRDGQCGTADTATTPMYCVGSVLNAVGNTTTRVAQLDGMTAIALGGPPNYGLFLDATGQLNGFGDNSKYQLGDGTMNSYGSVAPIGTQTYSAISTPVNDGQGDANFACAIRRSDQKVDCWGQASRGQTGASDTTTATTLPNEVTGLASCTAIATGVEHACAICGGVVSCWGDNRRGQLGVTASTTINSVPRTVDIPLAGDPWVQLVAGSRFTCARSTSGRVFCWGLSEHGALGTGATGANLPMTVLASQID